MSKIPPSNNSSNIPSDVWVTQLLTNPDKKARREAAWTLGQLKAKQAIKALIQSLSDPDIGVRVRVVEALGQLHEAQAVSPLISLLKQSALYSAELFSKFQNTAFDFNEFQFLKAETSKANKLEQALIITLGMLGNDTTLPLLDLLGESNSRLVCDVVRTLGQTGDLRATEPLIELMLVSEPDQSEPYNVCYCVVEALAQLGDKRAIDPLTQILQKVTDRGAIWIAEALGRLGDKRILDFLSEFIKDNNQVKDVRIYAASVLAELGDEKALPVLLWLVENEVSVGFENYVSSALERLRQRLQALPSTSALNSESGNF